ncbi:arsenate reductase ArsC [Nostocoides sp. F2B08]|uniref:arsenate-mycothiol transferase ArsC n=1 Tax=Nostocoides sp. F2B08 TaxID=2653936 RepID=UPI001263C9F9|nr:arsenate reductase ArsC [Tetrasphaera sp. F2B08]KAB7741416.1 arsenate reductase ArsC [Tetrasphaera sp. F2B08]
MDALPDEDAERIVDNLHHRYPEAADRETVAAIVAEARSSLESVSQHPEFLAILVQKRARSELLARAREIGADVHRVPDILFVCVHNAGRSPMAAAFAEHYAGDHVHVRSAGTDPADRLNPLVVEVMAERGIPVHDVPSAMSNRSIGLPDLVVHLGDHIPDLPGLRQVTWSVPDPEGEPIETVRAIADDLDTRVRDLLVDIGVPLVR